MNKNEDDHSKRFLVEGHTCSGFSALDQVIWGFLNGELIILAGYPGSGKTTFAMHIANINIVDFESHMAYFSTDDSARKTLDNLKQSNNAKQNKNLLKYSHLFVMGSLNIEDLCTKCRYLKKEFKIRMIIVDYLEHQTNAQESVFKAVKSLKNLAMEINIPILVILNIKGYNMNRAYQFPELIELGKEESFADMILFIRKANEPGFSNDIQLSEISIVKNPAEELKVVELRYDSHTGLLSDHRLWENL